MALELVLTSIIVLQLAMLAGVIALFRRTAGGTMTLSEEEAEAEAYLTHTVERLLQDLQQSADRATAGLAAQQAALEAIVSDATPAHASSALRESASREPSLPPAAGAPIAPTRATAAFWVDDARHLSREGMTTNQIARRIGRGEAEVRLALAAGGSQ